jgi:hypothetical protein
MRSTRPALPLASDELDDGTADRNPPRARPQKPSRHRALRRRAYDMHALIGALVDEDFLPS